MVMAVRLLSFLPVVLALRDTLVDEDICPMYYRGAGDCEKLKQLIRVNHTRALPTLEMGDPANPPILFFHGWPDTAALWVNQFEHFCAPPHGKYFCVAPTLTNFHPDFPDAPAEELFLDLEIQKFHAVVEQMGLQNLTTFMFDWGAALGYMFVYKYPELVKSVVAFDIGLTIIDPPGSKFRSFGDAEIPFLPQYQQDNIRAFRTGNFSIIRPLDDGIIPWQKGIKVPSLWRGHKPKFLQTRTCWPYNCIVLDGKGEEMSERLAPGVPFSSWKFDLVPDFPEDKPFMFFLGLCEDGTGCDGCVPCAKRRQVFYEPRFLDWVKARPSGEVVPVDKAGHWTMTLTASFVNARASEWLDRTMLTTIYS
jgi:pimeloyl-ACP methyl ester carboxylesterase